MGESSGSISLAELRSEVTSYLSNEEHDADLGEELLKNTVERVGALVSRVQGTFEFEVQPLREYFAARHLHKTAPYSPVGTTKKGTRPDRFIALAGNFYWTNVTRFFCGFYDKGELASLVEGIEQLSEDDRYAFINHPRRLSFMLLSDYVFSESPRTMRKLLEFVSNGNGFLRFISSEKNNNPRALSLPESGGQKIFFEMCAKRLEQEKNSFRRRQIRRVMGRNAKQVKRKEYWIENFKARTLMCDAFLCALDLRLAGAFSNEEIRNYFQGDLSSQLKWFTLRSRWEAIVEDAELYAFAKKRFLDGVQTNYYRHQQTSDNVTGYEMLSIIIQPSHFSGIFDVPHELYITQFLMRYGYFINDPHLREKDDFDLFAKRLLSLVDGEIWHWQSNHKNWEQLVDCGLEYAPKSHLFLNIALLSLGVNLDYISDEVRELNPEAVISVEEQPAAEWSSEGFNLSLGLVSRLQYASTKSDDLGWWESQYTALGEDEDFVFLKAMLCICSQEIIEHFREYVSERLEAFSTADWRVFCREISNAYRTQRNGGSDDVTWFNVSKIQSNRLIYLMALRASSSGRNRELGRVCFANYDGNDGRILNTAFSWEVHNTESNMHIEIDWDYFCELSKKIVLSNSEFGGYQSVQLDMPLEVAKDILENAVKHCSAAISIAERSTSAQSSETAAKVSDVATTNEWFALT